jgi:hypothetical protein
MILTYRQYDNSDIICSKDSYSRLEKTVAECFNKKSLVSIATLELVGPKNAGEFIDIENLRQIAKSCETKLKSICEVRPDYYATYIPKSSLSQGDKLCSEAKGEAKKACDDYKGDK